MRIERRLLHRILGAVPGLTGYMAGLRFLCVHKLVLFAENWDNNSINLKQLSV